MRHSFRIFKSYPYFIFIVLLASSIVSCIKSRRPNVPPPHFMSRHRLPPPRPDVQVVYPARNELKRRHVSDTSEGHTDNIAMDSKKSERKLVPLKVSTKTLNYFWNILWCTGSLLWVKHLTRCSFSLLWANRGSPRWCPCRWRKEGRSPIQGPNSWVRPTQYLPPGNKQSSLLISWIFSMIPRLVVGLPSGMLLMRLGIIITQIQVSSHSHCLKYSGAV